MYLLCAGHHAQRWAPKLPVSTKTTKGTFGIPESEAAREVGGWRRWRGREVGDGVGDGEVTDKENCRQATKKRQRQP